MMHLMTGFSITASDLAIGGDLPAYKKSARFISGASQSSEGLPPYLTVMPSMTTAADGFLPATPAFLSLSPL